MSKPPGKFWPMSAAADAASSNSVLTVLPIGGFSDIMNVRILLTAPSQTRRNAAGLAAFALISIAFYWKLTLTNQYTWLESPDLAHQVLPWIQYQAGEWRQGRLPLWASYEWGGQSLVGQGQPSAVYPPNWLLYLAPLKRGWLRFDVLNWYYVALHIFAGWFMFLLCRDLGSTFAASLGGAMVFAYGGYLGTIDWPQMVNGAIWAPLIFLFHLRAVRGRSPVANSAWSGFFLGVSWLSGHHQVPIFLTVALGFSCIWFLYRRQLSLRAALATGVVFPLVAAWQLLPAFEYGRLAKRWVGLEEPVGWKDTVPYFLHQRWSFFPISILGVAIAGIGLNTSAFVGVGAVSLAFTAWKERIYFAVLAVASLLYALALYGGIGGIVYSLVPMVEKARSPSMAVLLFGLAMGPLAAAGLDRLGRSDFPDLRRVLVVGAAAIVALYGGRAILAGSGAIPDQRPLMAAVAALAAAALLRWKDARARLAFLGVIFLELSWVAAFQLPNRFDKDATLYTPAMAANQDIVDYLRALPDPPRLLLDDEAIKFNFGDWHGVEVYGGYLASLSSNLLDAGLHSAGTLRMMGLTHWLGRAPRDAAQKLAYRGAQGVNLYEYPHPLPRAWIVHRAFRADSTDQARALIDDPAFDFRQGAVVSRDVALEDCPGSHAALLRRTSQRVVVGAEAACRGLLVLAEVHDPGWTVRVDGKPAELQTVNLIQRGVVVDSGWHVIEFRYRPASAIVGGVLTILGTLLAFAASIMKA
jgi:hypothetical protein